MSKVSVLRAADGVKRVLAKQISEGADGKPLKKSYDNCTQFTLKQPEVNGIEELSALLTKLESCTDRLIVRGFPHAEIDLQHPIRKRTFNSKRTPQSAPFIDEAIPWLMIDVDDQSLPSGLSLISDPYEAIAYVVSLLPEEFHKSSYHWQFSASAGLYGDQSISVHLWFWLSKPLTTSSLNTWAKSVNANSGTELIDTKMYQVVQAHYTSNPVFLGGFVNPISQRSGFVPGEIQDVDIDLTIQMPQPPPQSTVLDIHGYEKVSNKRMVTHYTTSGFDSILSTMGDDKDKFHMPILRAIGSFVGSHSGPLDLDDRESLKQLIRDQAEVCYVNPCRYEDGTLAEHLSDANLDSMIDSAIENFGTQAVEYIPPHYTHNPLTKDKAKKKLADCIDKFTKAAFYYNRDKESHDFYSGPPSLAIRASAGSGKTEQIISRCILNDAFRGNVEYYVPSHLLSADLKARLKDQLDEDCTDLGVSDASRIRVIAGRTQLDPNGIPLCGKVELTNQVSALGLSIEKTLCKDALGNECEFYRSCLYQKQFAEEVEPTPDDPIAAEELRHAGGVTSIKHFFAAVRVMSHEHLFLHTRDRLPDPELIVIDERFFTVGIEKADSPISDLLKVQNEVAKKVFMGLSYRQPLLKYLRDAGIDSSDLRDLANKNKPNAPTQLNPGMMLSEQTRLMPASASSTMISSLFDCLADEMSAVTRDMSHSVRLSNDFTTITVRRRKELTIPYRTPVIFIDADLNPQILSQFREDVKVVDVPFERVATVAQITDSTFSGYSLNGKEGPEHIRRAKRVIDLVSKQGDTLIVTNKATRITLTGELVDNLPKIGKLGTASIIHFGNLRGLDEFKDYANVIIIGRNQPTFEAVEALSGGLWWDSDDELAFTDTSTDGKYREARGYRDRANSGAGKEPSVHPDKRAQMIMEQLRESESTQALDRIRMIHQSDKPVEKKVFILSNVPLDITVDHLFSLKHLDKMLDCWEHTGGIISLNKVHLNKMWPESGSVDNAKVLVAKFQKAFPVFEMVMPKDVVARSDYASGSNNPSAAIHHTSVVDIESQIKAKI